MIAIDIYILEFGLNDKYLYIETSEKLLNIFNKKEQIKIFDLQN